MPRLARVLMVQGTASSVGKSTLVAGLCRLFARRGLRVAPFKAQNMSNNAAVCLGGGEIGRAQYAQAMAAGVEPTVDMNPILLKPQGGASQLVVRGRVAGTRTAAQSFGSQAKPDRQQLWQVVVDSLDSLRSTYDLVIAEGAGSPAEINLRDRDLVNMRVALHAAPDADVLLVGDIDRGGVFGALLGTWDWLTREERALIRGFVLNRFRGDASLLAPAPALLEQRTGIPVLGVVPFLEGIDLPEEDAASLTSTPARVDASVHIAVIHLPHVSNFDEWQPLGAEPGVWLRYVQSVEQLRAPDLVVLPGSKATVPDLLWMRERGLDARVRWLAEHGTPVLGVCGGFQMLGEVVCDPLHSESEQEVAQGIGLLPFRTTLGGDKIVRRVNGHFTSGLAGAWAGLQLHTVVGYEIHTGRSSGAEGLRASPLLDLKDRTDGVVRGNVAGTYVHGVMEQPAARHALLRTLAAARGLNWAPTTPRGDAFDRLADVLEASLQLEVVGI